tara:strand:+ start:63 stop:230 length:168 start_codon:yes stop_codon:yes gene_type:complete
MYKHCWEWDRHKRYWICVNCKYKTVLIFTDRDKDKPTCLKPTRKSYERSYGEEER